MNRISHKTSVVHTRACVANKKKLGDVYHAAIYNEKASSLKITFLASLEQARQWVKTPSYLNQQKRPNKFSPPAIQHAASGIPQICNK